MSKDDFTGLPGNPQHMHPSELTHETEDSSYTVFDQFRVAVALTASNANQKVSDTIGLRFEGINRAEALTVAASGIVSLVTVGIASKIDLPEVADVLSSQRISGVSLNFNFGFLRYFS
jgi:hypothetical protein